MKVVLVSAANADYFDLLLGLIRSIGALSDAPTVDLGVLDVGMTPDQLNQLSPLVSKIVQPGWDCNFIGIDRAPTWYKALVGRPHLPRYFPEYDLILWLDADTWFCTADGLRQLIHAAEHGYLAIIPELDRTYRHWFQPRAEDLQVHYEHYRLGWGDEIAKQYFSRTVINSGVFAMRSDSTGWRIWADTFEQGLSRATYPTVEQCSLNLAIYDGRIRAHFLPSTCNWICCQSLPLLDPNTRLLYSPMIPHERISIVHLINIKRTSMRVACTDGAMRQLPLTFDAVHATPFVAPIVP